MLYQPRGHDSTTAKIARAAEHRQQQAENDGKVAGAAIL